MGLFNRNKPVNVVIIGPTDGPTARHTIGVGVAWVAGMYADNAHVSTPYSIVEEQTRDDAQFLKDRGTGELDDPATPLGYLGRSLSYMRDSTLVVLPGSLQDPITLAQIVIAAHSVDEYYEHADVFFDTTLLDLTERDELEVLLWWLSRSGSDCGWGAARDLGNGQWTWE